MYDRTAAPYWADMILLQNQGHGIWWSYVDGTIYIEWICTSDIDHQKECPAYWHFQTTFDTTAPDFITYHYYEMGDTVINSTIGVQEDTSSKLFTGICPALAGWVKWFEC